MNRVRWSLFTKFALGISLTVIIFGLLNAVIVRHSVSRSLHEEFEKRGYFISRALAEQSVAYILSNDPAGLHMLINEIMAIDPTIQYAFILDGQGEVLAHSFREYVPGSLLMLNDPPADDLHGMIVVRDKNDPQQIIRDFSMATMSKNMGVARVGILEKEIRDQVVQTIASLWKMVAIFLVLGIVAALFFSYTISTPLKVLSMQSAAIDIRNIKAGLDNIFHSMEMPYFRLRRLFGLTDEIDVLYENYTEMLKRLEQAYHDMNNLQKSLLQSEKLASIGTLTAGIAHEINNPLAGIGISLKRIEKNPNNAEQIKKYTALMQEALSRIEYVMKDLLTFSRKEELVFETVNTLQLIQKTVKLAQYRVKNDTIQFKIDESYADTKLLASKNRIEQVFLNLIINGIDAISEKKVNQPDLAGEISIAIEESTEHVIVVFTDNGIGIPAGDVSKLFDPFYTTKDVGEGTGLGLSVSYQIVRDHGGEICVESEEGKGSRFFVLIPKHK